MQPVTHFSRGLRQFRHALEIHPARFVVPLLMIAVLSAGYATVALRSDPYSTQLPGEPPEQTPLDSQTDAPRVLPPAAGPGRTLLVAAALIGGLFISLGLYMLRGFPSATMLRAPARLQAPGSRLQGEDSEGKDELEA